MTEDEKIAASVDRHGWHAIAVDASEHEPSFLYTIGLCATRGHADLILFGLPHGTAHAVVKAIVAGIAEGRSYEAPGPHAGVLERLQILTGAVDPSQHEVYLGYAMAWYRRLGDPGKLRVVQIFWPDRAGRFPGDPAFDPTMAGLQPRLDGRPDAS